jgi:alkyl hydroperoxide reductase subunit AhpC
MPIGRSVEEAIRVVDAFSSPRKWRSLPGKLAQRRKGQETTPGWCG